MTAKRKTSLSVLAIRGVALNWIGRGLSFIVHFIATPILLTGLGDERYGLWSVIMSFAAFYKLSDFGLGAGCVKYMSEYEATGQHDAMRRIFRTAFISYTAIAAIVLLIAFPAAWFFPFMLELESAAPDTIRWVVLIVGLVVAIRMQSQVFIATIRAHKRFDIANLIAIVAQIVQPALIIGAILMGYGLLGMAVALLTVTVVSRFVEAYFAKRLIGQAGLFKPEFDRASFNLLLRFSGLNVVRRISSRIHFDSAPIIAGLALGPALVPYYAVANSIIDKAKSLVGSVGRIVMPVASELQAQQRRNQIVRMMIMVPRLITSFSLLMAIISFVLADEFIAMWIGEKYVAIAHPVLCILALGKVISSLSEGLMEILVGNGHLKSATKMEVAAALLYFPSALILISTSGLIGLAWASLVPSIVIRLIALPIYCCRLYEYSLARFIQQVATRPALAAVPVLAAALAMGHWFRPTSVVVFLVEVGVLAFISAVSTYVVCCDEPMRKRILASIPGFGRNDDPQIEPVSKATT